MRLDGRDKVLQQSLTRTLNITSNLDNLLEIVGDLVEILLLKTSCGQRRGTNTNTTRSLSRLITMDSVLVQGNIHFITNLLNLRASQILQITANIWKQHTKGRTSQRTRWLSVPPVQRV